VELFSLSLNFQLTYAKPEFKTQLIKKDWKIM